MDRQDITSWLVGPVCAVATPFKEDYSPDYEAFQSNIRWMIDNGMKTGAGALLVVAAGGEHPALSVDERKAHMDAAVQAADGEVPVLASIQHTDIRTIIELAQHADRVGIDAAQLGETYYYGNSASDFRRLFEAVGRESDVTLMVYYLSSTAQRVPLSTLLELKDIPTVGAVKWSGVDAPKFRDAMSTLSNDLAIVNNGGNTITGHMNGARAFVSHIANFWPQYMAGVWALLDASDYVGANSKLSEFDLAWKAWTGRVGKETAGEGAFIKAAMEAVGLPAGPPRPPAARPSEVLIEELGTMFEQAGVPRVS